MIKKRITIFLFISICFFVISSSYCEDDDDTKFSKIHISDARALHLYLSTVIEENTKNMVTMAKRFYDKYGDPTDTYLLISRTDSGFEINGVVKNATGGTLTVKAQGAIENDKITMNITYTPDSLSSDNPEGDYSIPSAQEHILIITGELSVTYEAYTGTTDVNTKYYYKYAIKGNISESNRFNKSVTVDYKEEYNNTDKIIKRTGLFADYNLATLYED